MDIRSFDDVVRKKPRIVNASRGGTRVYLDHRLQTASVIIRMIFPLRHEVFTTWMCGRAILSGEADTGIASKTVGVCWDFTPFP
jgi:molybdate-binding protein